MKLLSLATFFVLGSLFFSFFASKKIEINSSKKEKFSFSTLTPSLISTEQGFESSLPQNLPDAPGQLVDHLFNISGIPSPKGAIFSVDEKEIWITSLLNKKIGIFVFDLNSGKKIAEINLADGGGVEIISSKNGEKIFVSQMETAKIFEIDAKTKTVSRVFSTGGSWTKFLALSFDEKKLFASNWSSNDISEIDLETGQLIRKIKTVKTPRGIWLTKDGNYLYVAGFENGEIEKINLKTLERKVIFKTGGAMRHIVGDEEKRILYVSDMAKNMIFKVLIETDKVFEFVKTDNNPNTISLSSDGKILFVSCRGKNAAEDNYYIPGPEWGSVLLFDTESGELLDAIVGGNQPTALAVSSSGNYLAFSNFLDSNLEIFKIPSYDVLKAGGGGRSKIYKAELKK